MRDYDIIAHYQTFRLVIRVYKAGYSRVTHPFATKLFPEGNNSVRLACVKHAASVRPEPGSNS